MKSILTSVVVCFAFVAAARAEVTVSGAVRFWDPVRKSYAPAREAALRVEADCLSADLDVKSDESGRFTATIAEPFFGDSNVVLVATATAASFSVLASRLLKGPYSAASAPVSASPGGVITVDLTVGGPDDNVAAHRDAPEKRTGEALWIANDLRDGMAAFAKMGVQATALAEKLVLYPAAVGSSLTAFTFGRPESDDWKALALTMRHALAHAVFNAAYKYSPVALERQKPSHSFDDATAPELAWREAVATVMTCVSFGDRVPLAECAKDKGPMVDVLIDLMGPASEQPCAKQHQDAPDSVSCRAGGIGDKDLTKTWRIISEFNPVALYGKGEALADNFWTYWITETDYGATHALKGIFMRRAFAPASHPQNGPAVKIVAVSKPERAKKKKGKGKSFVSNVAFEIVEVDEEDRPHVGWKLYIREEGEPKWTKVAEDRWGAATREATLAVSRSVTVKGGFKEGTELRVVVDDGFDVAIDTFKFPEKIAKSGEAPFARGKLLETVRAGAIAAVPLVKIERESLRERRRLSGMHVERGADPVAPAIAAVRESFMAFERASQFADDLRWKVALGGLAAKHLQKPDVSVARRIYESARHDRVSLTRLPVRREWSENYQTGLDRMADKIAASGWIAATDKVAQRAAIEALRKRLDEVLAELSRLPAELKAALAQLRDKTITTRLETYFATFRVEIGDFAKAVASVESQIPRRIHSLREELQKFKLPLAGLMSAIRL